MRAGRDVTEILTAPARTGKTLVVVSDLVERFLPTEEGVFISNLPLGVVPGNHSTPPTRDGETFCDRIAAHVGKDLDEREKIRQRLVCLDDATVSKWKENNYGPWDTFADTDLTGAYIVLDEAHNFISANHSRSHRLLWQKWLAELGHQQATILFISQDAGKIAKEVSKECGTSYTLTRGEDETDPFFKIRLYFWYELRAKITGSYRAAVVRFQFRKAVGKLVLIPGQTRRFPREPKYFQFYDSFSKPHHGGVAGQAATTHEYQKRGWLSFLRWWFFSNLLELFKPVFFAAVVVLVLLLSPSIISGFAGSISKQIGGPIVEKTKKRVLAEQRKQGGAGETSRKRSNPTTPPPVRLEKLRTAEGGTVGDMAEPVEPTPGESDVITVITREWMMFADQRMFKVGEIIRGGFYEGKRVNAILYDDERVVVLGDARSGERVRVGVLGVPAKSAASAALTSFGSSVLAPGG